MSSGTRKVVMSNAGRVRQVFLYLAPFLGLASFKVWAGRGTASPESLLLAALAVLAYTVLVILLACRWDRPTYFDWAVTGYFAVISSALALWPEAAGGLLARYSVTGIYVCLFCAAFVPPLFGMDPFTVHYARKRTPETFWGNPIFVSINRTMTHVWAGLFAACIAISLYPSLVTRALIPLSLIVGVGVPFNLRFPDRYLRRLGLPSLAEQRRLMQTLGEPPPREAAPAAKAPTAPRAESTARAHSHFPKETAMNVIALNASPRGEGQSRTRMMLDSLVQGMREAGAEVEVVHLREKKVNNCIGCYTCWTKTPGVCVHQDDMTLELLPRWIRADLAVYATPLYHYTVTASMKAFIERTLPIVEPFILERDGRSSHPLRGRLPKAVVLSVAGFPEMNVFDQLSQYVRFLFRDGLLAEVYRPGAEAMGNPAYRRVREAVLEAVRQAGGELVRDRGVSPETMDRIAQPVASSEDYAKVANLFWKTCIAKGLTPKEFQEKNLVPRPDSLEAFMLILPMGFRPEAASELAATFQFDFTGQVTGTCHFTIENGKMQAKKGPAPKPHLVIQSPFEVWMDIMTREADGQEMFLAGKYKVTGDLSLLIRMGALFRG